MSAPGISVASAEPIRPRTPVAIMTVCAAIRMILVSPVPGMETRNNISTVKKSPTHNPQNRTVHVASDAGRAAYQLTRCNLNRGGEQSAVSFSSRRRPPAQICQANALRAKAPIRDTDHIPSLGTRLVRENGKPSRGAVSRIRGEFRCARSAFLLLPLRWFCLASSCGSLQALMRLLQRPGSTPRH
jgi:hypothetical protein